MGPLSSKFPVNKEKPREKAGLMPHVLFGTDAQLERRAKQKIIEAQRQRDILARGKHD